MIRLTKRTWLTLNVYAGNFSSNQSAKVYGYVTAPAGIVTINGGCELLVVS